jgi:stage V sporulation protein SpoVS
MSNNFRPTTLERAYELARSGECRTVGDIKSRLQQEGHERVQDRLYGGSLTSALRKLCVAHYVAPEGDDAAAAPADADLEDEDEDGPVPA